MSIVYGQLALCPETQFGARFRLAGCAGLLGGSLFAKTSELELARSTKRRVFASFFGLRGAARLSQHWTFLAQVGGVVPYRPERFVYELNGQRREFFRMSQPSWVAGVGCSVTF
jgi:hypothetical protein